MNTGINTQATHAAHGYKRNAETAATCLHHFAVRIGEMHPVAFRGFSLPDFVSLFRKDDFTSESAVDIFGIRGGLAAYALVKYGAGNLRKPAGKMELSLEIRSTYQILQAPFEIMAWSEESFYSALLAIMKA